MARQVQVSKMGKRYRKAGYKRVVSKRRKARESESAFRSYVPLIRRPDFGFPDKCVTRVRYCDNYDLTAAAGTLAQQTMRMNGLNDPDQTGIGHQPMWFDQWCGAIGSAPYSRYRVLGSKITVRFADATAPSVAVANHAPILVGVITQVSPTFLGTGVSQIMETSNSNWKILQDKSGSNNIVVVSNTYSPSRDLGVDAGDDSISAVYNANPTAQFYANVFKLDNTGTSTVRAYIEVEYLAEFYNRNEVNQS